MGDCSLDEHEHALRGRAFSAQSPGVRHGRGPEERAERRYKEDQMTAGASTTYAETLADMIERDRRDSTRADSPLKVAGDAIVIDSTGKNIDEVFEEMMTHVHRNH